MELDLSLQNIISTSQTRFQALSIQLNTIQHIDKTCSEAQLKEYRSILRSKEVYMTSANIRKMVQDGTRSQLILSFLWVKRASKHPSTINTDKYYTTYRYQMVWSILKEYNLFFNRKKSTWLLPTSGKWSRMELDRSFINDIISTSETSFQSSKHHQYS